MTKVRMDTPWILWWLLFSYVIHYTSAANSFLPPNINCVCPGDVLTYTCIITGVGNTKWGGSVFDCPEINDEITLRHIQYNNSGGTFGSCNGGNIQAKSIGVVESSYTSQLMITVNNDIQSNTTVSCTHISNKQGEVLIGSAALNFVLGPASYPPPSNISLAGIHHDNITFRWTSVAPTCSSVLYSITSTGCGDCPSNTYATDVTCSNITVPSTCNLSIQSVICSFKGNKSNLISIPLKFPDVPRIEEVIPHYSNDTQSLIKLSLNINQTSITTHRKLRTNNYKVLYENSSTKTNTIILANSSCTTEDCEYVVDVIPHCSSSASINVTVSAINALGEGAPSEVFNTGCRFDGNFIKVIYIADNNTVLCTFLNPLDTSEKSCKIEYGECGEVLSHRVEATSTSTTISLKINTEVVGQTLCYAITTRSSNLTYIITVEGQINLNKIGPHINITTVVIIAIVVPICVLLLIIIVLVAVIVTRKQKSDTKYKQNKPDDHYTVGEELKDSEL